GINGPGTTHELPEGEIGINGPGTTHELPEGHIGINGPGVTAEPKPTIDPSTVVAEPKVEATPVETQAEAAPAPAETTKAEAAPAPAETTKAEAAKATQSQQQLANTGASSAAVLALSGLAVVALGAGAVFATRRAKA
ncbi:LPXTG cell wall anchor domain-containing protein, partial [Rothia sp. 11273D007AR]